MAQGWLCLLNASKIEFRNPLPPAVHNPCKRLLWRVREAGSCDPASLTCHKRRLHGNVPHKRIPANFMCEIEGPHRCKGEQAMASLALDPCEYSNDVPLSQAIPSPVYKLFEDSNGVPLPQVMASPVFEEQILSDDAGSNAWDDWIHLSNQFAQPPAGIEGKQPILC